MMNHEYEAAVWEDVVVSGSEEVQVARERARRATTEDTNANEGHRKTGVTAELHASIPLCLCVCCLSPSK